MVSLHANLAKPSKPTFDMCALVCLRRGVAEPWGGPDRRELLGELAACLISGAHIVAGM